MRSASSRLAAAVRRMPARRRRVFLAVCDEAAAYAEIGQQLGLDAAEVEREFAAALLDLADALDPRPSWVRQLVDLIVGRRDR